MTGKKHQLAKCPNCGALLMLRLDQSNNMSGVCIQCNINIAVSADLIKEEIKHENQ